MTWLSSLPHQIPFRAATDGRPVSETVVEGRYLCTANDTLPVAAMVIEAMAQLAGALVLRQQGYLSGIDSCEILQPVSPGDVVSYVVTLEAGFGRTWRFSGVGRVGGVEVVRGRFYLASSDPHETS